MSLPIRLDDGREFIFTLLEGEDAMQKIVAFCNAHMGGDASCVAQLKQHVMAPEPAPARPLLSLPIRVDDGREIAFELYEGEDPAQKAVLPTSMGADAVVHQADDPRECLSCGIISGNSSSSSAAAAAAALRRAAGGGGGTGAGAGGALLRGRRAVVVGRGRVVAREQRREEVAARGRRRDLWWRERRAARPQHRAAGRLEAVRRGARLGRIVRRDGRRARRDDQRAPLPVQRRRDERRGEIERSAAQVQRGVVEERGAGAFHQSPVAEARPAGVHDHREGVERRARTPRR